MNFPQDSTDEHCKGADDSLDANYYIPAPTDVRTALQYTALTSITPASEVLKNLPPLSVSFGDFQTFNATDPEFVGIASLLESKPSQYPNINIQQQIQAVHNLMNQVDVSYVRFKNPSVSSSHYPEIDQHAVEAIFHKIDKGVKTMVFEQKSDTLSQSSSYPKVVVEARPNLPKVDEDLTSGAIVHKMNTIPSNLYPIVVVEPPSNLVKMSLNEDRKGDNSVKNLINNMSTIFEAEDSFALDPSLSVNLSGSLILLVPSSTGSNEPLLTTTAIRQLTKLINKVSRYKRLDDIEVEDLARVSKILERSVHEVEVLDVLPNSSSLKARSMTFFSKVRSNNNKNSESIDLNEYYLDNEYENLDDDVKLKQIEEKLDKVINGLEASVAIFSIMTGGKLNKQLYPEDLITSTLNLIKNQLGGLIYRILEINVSSDELSMSMVPIITNFLQRLYNLMQQEELSDTIVITVSFVAIGPFFVDTYNSGGNSIFGNGLETVKLVALGLLRLIFTNHPKQRTWILEEILTSLIKLPTAKRNLRQYRLPDGKSIQMVSALILQLIQSCTTSMRKLGSKPSIDREQDEELYDIEMNNDPGCLKKCCNRWKTGIDAASTNAGFVFKFLLARCTKSLKNSNESEYRLLLDNFMEDVIAVLNYPEWPAAEMIVSIFSKILVGYINDNKADTVTKSMALDHLGIIAGRIKKFANTGLFSSESLSERNWNDDDFRFWIDKVKDIPKGEITKYTQIQTVKNLWECQKAILTFLELLAMEDSGIQEQHATNFQSEYHEDNDGNKSSVFEMQKLIDKIVTEYWQMSSDVYDDQNLKHRSQALERNNVLLLTELLATRQSLYQYFDSILSRILVSLDTGVVAFRTKALRALSQVNVRQTIAQRLSDNSPAVRDAAIDLVGRYISQKPEITEQYYKLISDRVLDTGLNVRKRVIKLLRDIYLKSTDQQMIIDIGYEFFNMSEIGKKEVLSRSLLVVGVAGRLGERHGHIMGNLFKKILEKEGKQKREILNICQCIVDCLFEHLLTLQDTNLKTEVVSCISTICLLSSASPTLARKHVVTLQPYLKNQSILYYVLIIYRSVLPLLKRPNPSFLAEVEQALMSLLTKSPQKASNILQEVVPCLCVIVDKLTHNYTRLTKLLKSCSEKLKLEKTKLTAGSSISSARNVMVLLLIVGLLCKNFDFDKKRLEKPDEMKDLNAIDKGPIVTVIFQLVLYFCNENLSDTVQKMSLQSLGFIYLSHPTIMLRRESTDLMDRILNTGVMDMKIQLMKMFLDYLLSEQQKINADLEDKKKVKGTPVDLKVLIGNAEEFAEAGVSSSIMQRYLHRILECTFDPTQSLKLVALDVLGSIIQQGLVHPVPCMPTIVAMETSPESNIRDKAFKLHQHLNEKHASLIHSRSVECVKKAYVFQKQLNGNKSFVGENPTSYAFRSNEGHPEALINPMYSLLKEKRQRRNDFLISIVKTFDFDLKNSDESKVDVGFCKFVAENLATIDYKTIEEVLHIIYCINRVLSVVGITILHSIEYNTKSKDDDIKMSNSLQEEPKTEIQEQGIPTRDKVSICMAILMHLKDHLKKSYALSEMKCQSFNPTQSNSHKDKPALRHQNSPLVISWEGLPFVEKPFTTDDNILEQCELFKNLISEDGTQKDEFADAELESEITNRSNGIAN
ncbi:15208_t:CDS:10, partial [Entrophospora sp. SA101]